MRTSGVLTESSGLRPGDHVCWTFGSDEEHRAVLTTYLAEGIRAGQRVVYFGRSYAPETILGYVADAGLPAEMLAHSGALIVLDAEHAYLPDGQFDPPRMVRAFQEHVAAALSDGYTGLRASGEMEWLVPEFVDVEDYAAYEFKADRTTAALPMVALCGYDVRHMDATTIAALQAVHPVRLPSRGRGVPPFSLYASPAGTVVVGGEVDGFCASGFESAMIAAVRGSDGDVVLDFARLEFVDTAGLRALDAVARAFLPAGRRLVVCSARDVVRRCWDVLGFGSLSSVQFA